MDAIEKRARELLAAELHKDFGPASAQYVLDGNDDGCTALRAIIAALTPPEGYVLVPVEPTEEMIGDGAESRPMRPFTPIEEWEAFEAMTGCEQGWHKARLCWAAMIAARPDHIAHDLKMVPSRPDHSEHSLDMVNPMSVPDGFVLVPMELPVEMEIAFMEAWVSKRRCIDDPEMQDAWAAALAACPEVPR